MALLGQIMAFLLGSGELRPQGITFTVGIRVLDHQPVGHDTWNINGRTWATRRYFAIALLVFSDWSRNS